MNRSRSLVFAAALLSALSPTLPLSAAPEAEAAAGRALVKRYADAVVGVEMIVAAKIKMGSNEGRPQERRVEVNGTIISASGLVVTSLTELDPQAQFEAIRAAQPNFRGEVVSVEFKEVKLRLANGTEVPARFVLKDMDLDLAFMAPDESAGATKREFSYVKLEEEAAGAVLGSYFYVGRASKNLQRVPLVRASEITGIVEKPRKFYLLTQQALGTPVFDPQGKVLGITVQNLSSGNPVYIVLPAADVAEMAKQAAAAQAAPPPPPKVPDVALPAAEPKKD